MTTWIWQPIPEDRRYHTNNLNRLIKLVSGGYCLVDRVSIVYHTFLHGAMCDRWVNWSCTVLSIHLKIFSTLFLTLCWNQNLVLHCNWIVTTGSVVKQTVAESSVSVSFVLNSIYNLYTCIIDVLFYSNAFRNEQEFTIRGSRKCFFKIFSHSGFSSTFYSNWGVHSCLLQFCLLSTGDLRARTKFDRVGTRSSVIDFLNTSGSISIDRSHCLIVLIVALMVSITQMPYFNDGGARLFDSDLLVVVLTALF